MIIYTNQRSKKKKSKTKKELEQYQQWLDQVNSLKTNFSNKPINKSKLVKETVKVNRRETKEYKSLNSNYHDTSLKQKPVYTGDKLVGISMLHKSNLVPVFSHDEAKDHASMRR